MQRLELACSLDDVRAAVAEALATRDEAMRLVEGAISKAVRAGRMLNFWKRQVPHGGFMEWVEENLPDISHNTALRWMGLAKFDCANPGALDDAATVTRAYKLAGLLPEPHSEAGESAAQSDAWINWLVRSTTHLSARMSQRPIHEWPKEERLALRERLEPLVQIYKQLTVA